MRLYVLSVLSFCSAILFGEQYELGNFHSWELFPHRYAIAEDIDGSLRLGTQEYSELAQSRELYLSFEDPFLQKTPIALELGLQSDVVALRERGKRMVPASDKPIQILDPHSQSTLYVRNSDIETITEASHGFRSGVFRGDSGLELDIHSLNRHRSMFSSYAQWHEATISFDLFVLDVEDGADVFLWKHIPIEKNVSEQSIRAYIRSGKLVWEFVNLFRVGDEYITVIVENSRVVVPKIWQSYQLTIDRSTARMHYFIDEELVAVRSIADEPRLVSAIILPGILQDFSIGQGYKGYIDEFLITSHRRDVEKNLDEKNLGQIMSDIVYFGESQYDIEKIIIHHTGDEQLFSRFSYRLFSDFADADRAIWAPIVDTIPMGEREGRFLQIHLELLTDKLIVDPVHIQSVSIEMNQIQPLPSPDSITIRWVRGVPILSWNRVNMYGVAGYYVRIAQEPWSREVAAEATRFIDVGDTERFEIEGFNLSDIYYVSVASYRTGELPSHLVFSHERSLNMMENR